MRYFLPLLLFFLSAPLFSQQDSISRSKQLDSSDLAKKIARKSKETGKQVAVEKVSIKDYKIISYARDTTFLDTTQTIQKEYAYNYIRRDVFELMPFSNVGQPYNKLGVNFESTTMYPVLGAKAKHFNYMEVEDINYYNVATPMTDLFFKTTFEKGQLLDALLTFNTSRRFNFSIAYKGFRSFGKYQFNQAQSGNFRTTLNYETKNKRYNLRAHIAAQNIDTEENGGLPNPIQFESGESEFRDRSRIDVRFTDADNKLLGKRYFFDHQYKLIKKNKDSSLVEKTSLALGHQFNYETKYQLYTQTAANPYFGDALLPAIYDRANLKTMHNEFNVEFYNAILGRLRGNISLLNYNYFFNSKIITDTQQIQNQLKGTEVAIGADYKKQIGGFKIDGGFKYKVSGSLTGSILNASAGYRINEANTIKVTLFSLSRMPDFNILLYQSDYTQYNWQNTDTFQKQSVNSLQFMLDSNLWGSITAKYSRLGNYTYFTSAPDIPIEVGKEEASVRPYQEKNSINHLKLKYAKEFRLGAFALNNTILYQVVNQTNNVLNVPQIVTRNTLYYSSDVFKKAMYLQTGITFKYFTSYYMDAYNPLLSEFYVQDAEKLGGYPMFDFFINARVKQTRIYLKAEHFNSGFGKRNYYAAPGYPYRDFVIRFGLVWNFFS
ncbi:MAG: putative porin [Maribacter sp.]|nr:putative porin [Maribacter sp.]